MAVNRPPLAKAREAATKALINNHADEYQELVNSFLASAGWAKQEVTKEVWRQTT